MSGDPWSIEEYQALIHRSPTMAVPDGMLRYTCTSRKDPNKKYVQELDAYNGNGMCSCPDFHFNLEKYLKRGLTGRQAFEQGLIKQLKPYHFRPDDALRCFHLMDARWDLLDSFVNGVIKLERERAAKIHAHVA